MTVHATWDEQVVLDPPSRMSFELSGDVPGITKLTVIHDLEGAPTLAAMVAGGSEAEGAGGGWAWVLSDLKSLLETGAPLAG